MRDPLVFLPGMMCDLRLFSQQLIDLGCELPVTVAPITQGERIEEIASNLLDALPRRFALAGLSLGGIVAMEILRRAPDRVTSLALLDTNPLPETPQSATDYEPFIIKLRSASLTDAIPSFFRPEYLAPGPGRAEVMGQLIEMAENIGVDAIIRQVRAMQRRRDYQATLRRCKVPALVLCGRHDALTPLKRHSFMADLIPVADLAVIEDAGHLPTLEAPKTTTEALRSWLKLPYLLQTRAEA